MLTKLILLATSVSLASSALAGPKRAGVRLPAGNSHGIVNSMPIGLPKCINDEPSLAVIVDAVKVNPKNPHKYDGYRQVLKDETDAQIFARLSYAETMAANCASLNQKMLPLVAETIADRIRIRRGDVRGVVFQRDQYSSSLNIYQESRYREFLCPRDEGLWTVALNYSLNKLVNLNEPGLMPGNAVHYYLYLHSTRLAVPDWADENNDPWPMVTFDGESELHACIRFFRDVKWR